MYTPATFKEDRPDVLHAFIEGHGFATLVSHTPTGLIATHLPMLLDRRRGPTGMLTGHVAVQNEHWRALEAGVETLAIFHGPHAYVSPTWYVNPVSVPTWNYVAVHAYGVPRIVAGDALRVHLEALTRHYESGRPAPWALDRLPADVVERLQGQIVGFELEITRLEGKWKLGQNRSPADREGAMAGLRKTGDPAAQAVANAMAATLG